MMRRTILPGLVILLCQCRPVVVQVLLVPSPSYPTAPPVTTAPPVAAASAVATAPRPATEAPSPEMLRFETYRDRRIAALRSAFADKPEVNARWREHALDVERLARAPRDTVMGIWRGLVADGAAQNEYEGITLNSSLTSADIAEILASAPKVTNTYWILVHLKRHPNRPPGAAGAIPKDILD